MAAPTNQENGQGAAEEAREKAGELAEQAQERAQQAAGQVQERIRQQLGERSGQLSEQITTQASDLRSVGETLRSEGKEEAAKVADRLAGYAERAGRYLGEKDPQAMLGDVEQLGRRQPWAMVAGGLFAGFTASRLLKASSRRRYEGHLTMPRPNGVYAGNGAGAGETGSGAPPAIGAASFAPSIAAQQSGIE